MKDYTLQIMLAHLNRWNQRRNEVLDVIKRYYPQIKVEYQPARTVDADIIYLCNDRLKSIYKKPMVSLEDGIEAYYIYLKTSKDEFDQGLS